jgi:hypothetical protein
MKTRPIQFSTEANAAFGDADSRRPGPHHPASLNSSHRRSESDGARP